MHGRRAAAEQSALVEARSRIPRSTSIEILARLRGKNENGTPLEETRRVVHDRTAAFRRLVLLLGRDHLVCNIHHNITPSVRDYLTSGPQGATLFGVRANFADAAQIL